MVTKHLNQREISPVLVWRSPSRQQTIMADYREAPLATRPKTLDPNEYFNLSPEHRRTEEARAAIRANLKRQYQTQLNNPHRNELIVSGYWLASNVTLEQGSSYLQGC